MREPIMGQKPRSVNELADITNHGDTKRTEFTFEASVFSVPPWLVSVRCKR